MPIPSGLPNNNSSVQITQLTNGHLAIVFNNVRAKESTERRLSLYDEIEDEGASNGTEVTSPAVGEPAAEGRSAYWGTPRAPLRIGISEDGGRTWSHIRDLEVGDGFCLTNNSSDARNREYSYPSIKQTPDGAIHIAYTYYRQRIKYVRIREDWVVKG